MRWTKELREALQDPLGHVPGHFSLPQMRRMWHAAMRERQVEWSSAKGPLAIARLSLRRLQWEWPAPFALVTDRGDRIDLLGNSLALVESLFIEAWHRRLERLAADTLHHDEFANRCVFVGHIERYRKSAE